MRLTQLTERARVPRAQVFRAFQALLVPLAPLGVVREKGWACRRALRARRAARACPSAGPASTVDWQIDLRYSIEFQC